MSNKKQPSLFSYWSSGNNNRTPSRNNNNNYNNNNRTNSTSRTPQNNSFARNSTGITPAMNRMGMTHVTNNNNTNSINNNTRNNNANNFNHNNSHNSSRNNNNNNQTHLSAEQKAMIEQKRQAAIKRRQNRGLNHNNTNYNNNNSNHRNNVNTNNNFNNLNTSNNNSNNNHSNNNSNNTNHNIFNNNPNNFTNSTNSNGNFNSPFNNNNNTNRVPLTNTTNTTIIAPGSTVRRSDRKRPRAQYNFDSDEEPIQPQNKRARLSNNNSRQIAASDEDWNPTNNDQQSSEDYTSPSTSPKKRKLRRNKNENDNSASEEDFDVINNNNSNSNNNNKNKNKNINNNENKEADTMDKIAQFQLFDEDDDRKNELVERDSKYMFDTYKQHKEKSDKIQSNIARHSNKKAAGASHRDVSQYNWYKKPKDHSGRSPGHRDYNPTQILVPKSFYSNKSMTTAQQQYWKLKADHFDGILAFKVGKFYELYYMDAEIAHKLCGLSYMGGDAPHVGFPEKSFNKFAECFVKYGYKVYRVEQTETKEQQKHRKAKVVRREICEVISKGTIVPEEFLDDRANYILSITEELENKATSQIDVGVCFMDFSTGAIHVGRFMDDRNRSRLRTLMYQINASEIVFKRNAITRETRSLIKMEGKEAQITGLIVEDEFYSAQKCKVILSEEKYWGDTRYPDVLDQHKLIMNAFGGILFMLQQTMHDHEILPHSSWNFYDPTNTKCTDVLTLDGSTLGNLEILRNDVGTKRGTLIEFVDRCHTKFGKRMMERWLRAPLNKLELINERLDAVDEIIRDSDYWFEQLDVNKILSDLPDLERLLHNLAVLGTKGRAMDKAVLFESCWNTMKIEKLLKSLQGFETINELLNQIENHRNEINSKLINDITTIIHHKDMTNTNNMEVEEDEKEEKKMNKDRNIIEFATFIEQFRDSIEINDEDAKNTIIQPVRGADEEFDRIMDDLEDNEQALEKILCAVQKRFKCRNNKDIKWYHKRSGKTEDTYQIEISKRLTAGKVEVPEEWHLKSSISKVDRYHTDGITDLLKKRGKLMDEKEELLRDSTRVTFARFAAHGAIWKRIVHNIAVLDCLLSLAHVSQHAIIDMARPQFVKSEADGKAFLEIRECRHPCIEDRHLTTDTFIPNDTVLGTRENPANFVIVTGPNMGGKSTLLRQTCVAVILAHIGCYVPCKSMRLTAVDRIFTRIGANDRILAGQSTFMVELEETSNILQHATNNSLVILDELGRGTSTFDGTAIAYAVAKELIDVKNCRCLFSTHYHGLCDSFADNPKVEMYHMSFKQSQNEETITFLYKFTKGVCQNSHGINCAKLAFDNLRFKDMLKRAQEKSEMLHTRMHCGQDLTKQNELIAEFKSVMQAMIGDTSTDDELWMKIQNDIQKNNNHNNNNNMSG